jgi:hypothetical protein
VIIVFGNNLYALSSVIRALLVLSKQYDCDVSLLKYDNAV